MKVGMTLVMRCPASLALPPITTSPSSAAETGCLSSPMSSCRPKIAALRSSHTDNSYAEHIELLGELKKGDIDGAIARLNVHIDRTRTTVADHGRHFGSVSFTNTSRSSITKLMRFLYVAAKLECPVSAKLKCHSPRV